MEKFSRETQPRTGAARLGSGKDEYRAGLAVQENRPTIEAKLLLKL